MRNRAGGLIISARRLTLILIFGLAAAGAALAIALVRTLATPAPPSSPAGPPLAEVDPAEPAARLARAVRYPTVVREDAPPPAEAFAELHQALAEMFPGAHRALRREVVAEHSLLFTWPGTDGALEPALLLGHLDVVPVESSSRERWQAAPFGGVVEGGFIWGRGALDNKGPVLAILEAVERLVGAGYQPERTLLLAFGHDEEIGGRGGARAIAARLREREVRPWFVLDEGGAVIEDLIPGLEVAVAMVAVGEKGYVTLDLLAAGAGGHSSAPPATTAVGRLARTLAALEKDQMPAHLDRGVKPMLEALAPHLPFDQRFVARNLWLLGPLVEHEIGELERGNALLRTTTAPTMLAGSQKENVLPSEARAVVNFRVMPGESVADVVDHVSEHAAREGVEVSPRTEGATEPPTLSPAEGPAWDVLTGVIGQAFPEAAIIPGLMIAGTDSRHYLDLTENVYRFAPLEIGPDDTARFHGLDERIPVEEHARMIAFYERFLERALSRLE